MSEDEKRARNDRLAPPEDPSGEQPEVYGIVRADTGFTLTRRSLWSALGVGVAAAAACKPQETSNNSAGDKPPGGVGGQVTAPKPAEALKPAEVPKPAEAPKPKPELEPAPEPDDSDDTHTKKRNVRQMSAKTFTLPCGSKTPEGAVCICDCIAASANYRSTIEQTCICDTIEIAAGRRMPMGTVCTCDTICTCDTVGGDSGGSTFGGGHYWYPN